MVLSADFSFVCAFGVEVLALALVVMRVRIVFTLVMVGDDGKSAEFV